MKVTSSRPFLRSFALVMAGAATSQLLPVPELRRAVLTERGVSLRPDPHHRRLSMNNFISHRVIIQGLIDQPPYKIVKRWSHNKLRILWGS